ncbi:MAG: RpiR family transcriptional regulator [Microbacteriaceae bacterium]|nr:RpiR family transcriptional regulator [Microbacteriaceae bacterium]
MIAPGTIADRIAETYPELSPQEQRAEDFMRDHLDDLAVYNATEVANLSGVSKATISRLYRRLGFDSAEDLRDHVRALRSTGTPIVTETAASFAEHLDQELANLRAALAGLDLQPSATLIAGARRVLVLGFRNSYPMALHLRQQLAQAREGVELAPLPGQSVGEELASLGKGDVAVLVGFRRRPSSFARLVETLAAGPASVVLLTDAGGRRYAGQVDQLIECPVDSVSAFDSYAAAASVVNLLSSAVLGQRVPEGRARIAGIGQSYQSLDELETV